MASLQQRKCRVAGRLFRVADAVEKPGGRTHPSTVLIAHILIKGRLHNSRGFAP